MQNKWCQSRQWVRLGTAAAFKFNLSTSGVPLFFIYLFFYLSLVNKVLVHVLLASIGFTCNRSCELPLNGYLAEGRPHDTPGPNILGTPWWSLDKMGEQQVMSYLRLKNTAIIFTLQWATKQLRHIRINVDRLDMSGFILVNYQM